MNIEKIEINGHYVWVDKDVTTMTNTPMGYCYNSLKSESDWTDKNIVLHQGTMPIYHYRGLQKIIAASPELNLEGVPVYDAEWLAEQYAENWEEIHPELNPDDIAPVDVSKIDFIAGYQTAEKELPTWDDVRKAINLSRNLVNGYSEYTYSVEGIIEQLKKKIT